MPTHLHGRTFHSRPSILYFPLQLALPTRRVVARLEGHRSCRCVVIYDECFHLACHRLATISIWIHNRLLSSRRLDENPTRHARCVNTGLASALGFGPVRDRDHATLFHCQSTGLLKSREFRASTPFHQRNLVPHTPDRNAKSNISAVSGLDFHLYLSNLPQPSQSRSHGCGRRGAGCC